MDSADELSGYMPIRTASTWDYGVGPLCCSLVRGLFRRQQYRGLRRDWTAYSGSGRWVCFTGQPRTVQEYKGQGLRWQRFRLILLLLSSSPSFSFSFTSPSPTPSLLLLLSFSIYISFSPP